MTGGLQVWGRQTHDDGLVTSMVGSVHWPAIVRAFDPEGPDVLLLGHDPLNGFVATPTSVPLARSRLRDPEVADVVHLTMDVYLSVSRLIALAEEMHGSAGLLAVQLARKPREVPNLNPYVGDEWPAVRSRYRALGLMVKVNLPFDGDDAQITTLTDEGMDAALTRILSSEDPTSTA